MPEGSSSLADNLKVAISTRAVVEGEAVDLKVAVSTKEVVVVEVGLVEVDFKQKGSKTTRSPSPKVTEFVDSQLRNDGGRSKSQKTVVD